MQVTLGGQKHALTVLQLVNPAHIHVFDEPAVYGGALWLPYRKEQEVLEAAIREAGPAVRAIFAHVDVVSD